MRLLVTGAEGLLGTHMRALIQSKNSAAEFAGKPQPFELVVAGREEFSNKSTLSGLLQSVDTIFHFAGVNRGTDKEVAFGNQSIAKALIDAVASSDAKPHVLYANSTHCEGESAYGKGKQQAADLLALEAARTNSIFTNMVLPHVFGEGGKPFYNSVTSTLCYQLANGEESTLNSGGGVELLHAGEVARIALAEALKPTETELRPEGFSISVEALYEKLRGFYENYKDGLLPELGCSFDVALFNTLRSYLFPQHFPVGHVTNVDERGVLYEVVKGGRGQTFLSWTKPGITRGDHFHLNKVERFSVVSGEAIIRIRHLFQDVVHEFRVSGANPVYIDMPTMHTHSIENVGEAELLTLFWSNEIFDPKKPDTYALKVLNKDE